MIGREARRRRRVAAARAGWGATLAVAPASVLDAVGDRPDATARWIVRLLGVRHLAQAALSALRPTHRTLVLSVATDAIHAATALALAAADRRWRRAALADAAVAACWAAVGRRGLRRRPEPLRLSRRPGPLQLSRRPGPRRPA